MFDKIIVLNTPCEIEGKKFGKGTFLKEFCGFIYMASHGYVDDGGRVDVWKKELLLDGSPYWRETTESVADPFFQEARKMGLLEVSAAHLMTTIRDHVGISQRISFIRDGKKIHTANLLNTPPEYVITDLGRMAEDAILSGAHWTLEIEETLVRPDIVRAVTSGQY